MLPCGSPGSRMSVCTMRDLAVRGAACWSPPRARKPTPVREDVSATASQAALGAEHTAPYSTVAGRGRTADRQRAQSRSTRAWRQLERSEESLTTRRSSSGRRCTRTVPRGGRRTSGVWLSTSTLGAVPAGGGGRAAAHRGTLMSASHDTPQSCSLTIPVKPERP